VGQEIGGRRLTIACSGADDIAKFHRVPENDDGGEAIHAADSVVLPFVGAVAYFVASMETYGWL
jgi:hypothetical protein